MAKKFTPIMPTRGTQRLRNSIMSKKKSRRWLSIPYVRHGEPTVKSRPERVKCMRSLFSFVGKSEKEMYKLLSGDRLVLDWTGRSCPHCRTGMLRKSIGTERGPRWRCNSGRQCGKSISAHYGHPLLTHGRGLKAVPLSKQACILFCLLSGCKTNSTCMLLDVNHKAVESMQSRINKLRMRCVRRCEKKVTYGRRSTWTDVEADEMVVRKRTATVGSRKFAEWEQWAGCIERGRPSSLSLWKTTSSLTEPNAPGPGAIKKGDWIDFAFAKLANRRVILHSDGARSYRLRVPGLLHDAVVHKKSSIK